MGNRRFFYVSIVLSISLFLCPSLWAKSFINEEKNYSFQYDESIFTLVYPGFLTTDLVLHRKDAESGFFPNLTITSKVIDSAFNLDEEVARTRAEASKIFPGIEWVRAEPLIFKGEPAYFFELKYQRDNHLLFLRAFLIRAPRRFMSLSITTPVETAASHLAAFMPVIDSLEIHHVPSATP